VEHMLKLYTDDLSTPRSALVELEMPMVRLVLAVPGPKRSERFLYLYETKVQSKVRRENGTWFYNRNLIEMKRDALKVLRSVEGRDIDGILLKMPDAPKRFNLLDAQDLWPVLDTLAGRGNNAIKEPLERFLADPQEGALGVTHYEGLEYTVRMVREVLATLAQSQPRSDDREEHL